MRKRRASSTESESQVSDYTSDASVVSNKKRRTEQQTHYAFPAFSSLSLQPEPYQSSQAQEVEMQAKPEADHIVYVNSLSDSEDERTVTEEEQQEARLRSTMARKLIQIEQERAANWRNPQLGAVVLYQPVIKREEEQEAKQEQKVETGQDEASGMDLDE